MWLSTIDSLCKLFTFTFSASKNYGRAQVMFEFKLMPWNYKQYIPLKCSLLYQNTCLVRLPKFSCIQTESIFRSFWIHSFQFMPVFNRKPLDNFKRKWKWAVLRNGAKLKSPTWMKWFLKPVRRNWCVNSLWALMSVRRLVRWFVS